MEYTTLGKVRYSFQSRHYTNLCCLSLLSFLLEVNMQSTFLTAVQYSVSAASEFGDYK